MIIGTKAPHMGLILAQLTRASLVQGIEPLNSQGSDFANSDRPHLSDL